VEEQKMGKWVLCAVFTLALAACDGNDTTAKVPTVPQVTGSSVAPPDACSAITHDAKGLAQFKKHGCHDGSNYVPGATSELGTCPDGATIVSVNMGPLVSYLIGAKSGTWTKYEPAATDYTEDFFQSFCDR
jgi:hypothetical protein